MYAEVNGLQECKYHFFYVSYNVWYEGGILDGQSSIASIFDITFEPTYPFLSFKIFCIIILYIYNSCVWLVYHVWLMILKSYCNV